MLIGIATIAAFAWRKLANSGKRVLVTGAILLIGAVAIA